ncbi:NifU family protein [Mycobacterium sp. IDR2000157661]|uniref:NifU family protein n=1 Tax=Mycobacterium sp. IDR2000157661 TaxID=2867005 RepID=UPI001EEB4997|nr:NifU family protein [Mycobacterium sp. IDR2000157661]ULE32955.1 NifU family protein [Mycobacterium sp. IDR2000157661]
MSPSTLPGPEEIQDDAQWRTAGDRIQTLLDASAAGGLAAQERAVQLVGEVTDLYGAALARMMRIATRADPQLADAFAGDDLVASLLLVHGLHPHAVERRVEEALDGVRPYLGSHGGDVSLLEVVDDVVRLQFTGSCKSCPSSATTLELTVEDAVRAAAPEIVSIEVVAAESAPGVNVIPADSLLRRVHQDARPPADWHPLPDLADLAPEEVGGFSVAATTVLACRVGDELFVYHDRCGNCEQSLAGAVLHRPMGSPVGAAILRCPKCRAHFDVVHAGTCVDRDADPTAHLEPIPLLVRDGNLSIAVAGVRTGAGMA